MNLSDSKRKWMTGALCTILCGFFASVTFAETAPKPDCECTGNMTKTYTKQEDYNGDGILDTCTYTKECNGTSRCEQKTVTMFNLVDENGNDIGDITITYTKTWGQEKFLSCALGKKDSSEWKKD